MLGFDIEKCEIDYTLLDIQTESFLYYKKSLRVKIRALMKTEDIPALNNCFQTFFTLAHYAKHLFGHHSCKTPLAPWQMELAYQLKETFNPSLFYYQKGEILTYETQEIYENRVLVGYHDKSSKEFFQNYYPFLNPKDYAHFDKFVTK